MSLIIISNHSSLHYRFHKSKLPRGDGSRHLSTTWAGFGTSLEWRPIAHNLARLPPSPGFKVDLGLADQVEALIINDSLASDAISSFLKAEKVHCLNLRYELHTKLILPPCNGDPLGGNFYPP
jgi:hypothetical protein